jgi:malto-oligosyltrehalose synthase
MTGAADPPTRRLRHLGSTYRLQLNGIGFAAAAALVPFLAELGIETCYVSPVTRARSGSSHGYDVADPMVIDPALGGADGLAELFEALARHDIGLLVDIVPNHMAASPENPYFLDVLRHGRESRYARYFGIAWDEQDGRVLLPVLGRPVAELLDAGELSLVADNDAGRSDGGGLWLRYAEHRYPLTVGGESTGSADVIAACDTTTADGRARLAALIAQQPYRLADWRVANQQVNYRRFFDINELIGVRQEDETVFADTHALVAELARNPVVAGFRVDHIDGLRDPERYLLDLRELIAADGPDPVVLVEKILARAERLPPWPVAGTTGYEFADLVLGLFVDADGAAALATAAAEATSDGRSFGQRALDAKRRIVEVSFPHQLDRVVASVELVLAGRINEESGSAPPAEAIRAALRELTAHLEVYRTYRRPAAEMTAADRRWLAGAAQGARATLTAESAAWLDAAVEVLSGPVEPDSATWNAVAGWQQLTGPVAAKGVEDTAMYDPGGLLAVADVGSAPDHPAVAVAEFHAAMAVRSATTPSALSSTSTHDSKRSHDVRCRLAVLSEFPAEWERAVAAVDAIAIAAQTPLPDVADRRYLYQTLVGAWPIADDVDESFRERIVGYLVKASRESKRHGGWLDPDEDYERSLTDLASRIVTGDLGQARQLLAAVVADIEVAGATNALASVVLKATAPGVPDTYQGDDSWLLALVDPDNRRPLDVDRHRGLLAGLPLADGRDSCSAVEALLSTWRSGALKQLVLRQCLLSRRGDRATFSAGRYLPLEVTGTAQDHVVAFARESHGVWFIAVVPRGVRALAGPARFPVGASAWGDTALTLPPDAPPQLTDVISGGAVSTTGGTLPIAAALGVLPVALLRGERR